LNLCASHVFTQVTAISESLPLISPAALRRQMASSNKPAASTTSSDDFSLVAPLPRKRPHQIRFESLVPVALPNIPPKELATQSEVIDLEKRLERVAITLQSQEEEMAKREEQLKSLEGLLEQERSSRAQDANQHQETKDTLWLFEQENQELRERDALISGGKNEPSEALRPLWSNVSGLFQTMHNLGREFRRLEHESNEAATLQEEADQLREENARMKAKIEVLSSLPKQVNSSMEIPDRNALADLFVRTMQRTTLSEVLECVLSLFGDRLEILPSAIASAKASADFKYPARAMKLLVTLATGYWEAISIGVGDAEARKVFGPNVYAAKESETLSKDGVKRRTFDRQGTALLMEKHLKIGIADNASDTLRVHFDWSSSDEKIVIGWCGKHLNF
jgi:hypothetical protein